MKRIGYLSPYPLEDKSALSGTMFTMAEALKHAGYQIVWIPVKFETFLQRFYQKIISGLRRAFPSYRSYFPRHPFMRGRTAWKKMDKKLLESCDVLFVPIQSEALFAVETRKPIVYLSDCTFRIMVGYYYFGLPKKDMEERDFMERTAIEKATALVYPCQWAARSAVQDYNQPLNKITIAKFGYNINPKDIVPHYFDYKGRLDILFIGVDWERKGGGIAVEACRWLNLNGIDSTIHIVGAKNLNEEIVTLPFVDYIGFLDKNVSGDYDRIVSLYKSSDCFLLPTLAECTGIVFCEASAFGLPCFSHDTGGVGDYVIDGENGAILPIGSTGEDFGRTIKTCLENGELSKMSRRAVEISNSQLNWKVWAESVGRVIEGTL